MMLAGDDDDGWNEGSCWGEKEERIAIWSRPTMSVYI